MKPYLPDEICQIPIRLHFTCHQHLQWWLQKLIVCDRFPLQLFRPPYHLFYESSQDHHCCSWHLSKALYDHEWKAYEGYIAHISTPTTASPQVAEYLQHPWSTRKLKGSTLASYIYNFVIATTTVSKVSLVTELQAHFRSYKLADKSSRFRPTIWDLNVILHHLTYVRWSRVRLLHRKCIVWDRKSMYLYNLM